MRARRDQPVSDDAGARRDSVPRDHSQRGDRAGAVLRPDRSRFAIGGIGSGRSAAIILAGVLDGLDGRIARLLRAQSRFGAELDSLSDNIAFGTAPALILFLWSLAEAPRFGWIAALALAVCCALRLARFNARIDVAEQPHKSAGFNTGVPAPAGAGLAFVPIYLWLITGNDCSAAGSW